MRKKLRYKKYHSKLTEHKTLVGSIFYSTTTNKKTVLLLPKNKEEFLWVDEGLCPECNLDSLTDNFLETKCKICGSHSLPLLTD